MPRTISHALNCLKQTRKGQAKASDLYEPEKVEDLYVEVDAEEDDENDIIDRGSDEGEPYYSEEEGDGLSDTDEKTTIRNKRETPEAAEWEDETDVQQRKYRRTGMSSRGGGKAQQTLTQCFRSGAKVERAAYTFSSEDPTAALEQELASDDEEKEEKPRNEKKIPPGRDSEGQLFSAATERFCETRYDGNFEAKTVRPIMIRNLSMKRGDVVSNAMRPQSTRGPLRSNIGGAVGASSTPSVNSVPMPNSLSSRQADRDSLVESLKAQIHAQNAATQQLLQQVASLAASAPLPNHTPTSDNPEERRHLPEPCGLDQETLPKNEIHIEPENLSEEKSTPGDFQTYPDEGQMILEEELDTAPKTETKAEIVTSKKIIIPENFHLETLSLGDTGPEEDLVVSATTVVSEEELDLTSDDGTIPFYFIDAHEDPQGKLYLFGRVMDKKTKNTMSCCVFVDNMERNFFAHSNEHVPEGEELQELVIKEMEGEHLEEEEAEIRQAEIREGILAAHEQKVNSGIVQDLQQIKEHFRIPKIKVKGVRRHYAFEQAAMKRGKNLGFVKCSYSARIPVIEASEVFEKLKLKRITHLFGTRTSLIELFILKRKIKGPCWLKIRQWTNSPSSAISHCQRNLIVQNHKSLCLWGDIKNHEETDTAKPSRQPDPPLLNIIGLTVKTLHNKQAQHEVCMTALVKIDRFSETMDDKQLFVGSYQTVGLRKTMGDFPTEIQQMADKNPRLVLHPTEQSLLVSLCNKLQALDPDVIVGHNIYGHDLEVLAARLGALKLGCRTKFSRLKRKDEFQGGGSLAVGRRLTVGRLVCDTYLQSRDLLRNMVDYKLHTLAVSQLGVADAQLPRLITAGEVPELYKSGRGLAYMVQASQAELKLSLRLMHNLQMLPLTRELTGLAGNLWIHSLQSKRAERNDWLLAHQFREAHYICPDKPAYRSREDALMDSNTESSKGGPSYSGGLVLEPKMGLYDTFVLLLDFNSLYPSIIQEFNICFTTVERPDETGSKDFTVTNISSEPGILPGILGNLVARRRAVKNLIKGGPTPILKVREMALKLTANSLYGTLGYKHSRFHSMPIAAHITRLGRQLLETTKKTVELDLRMDVIYGDTDSIMVNSGLGDDPTGQNYNEAKKLAQKIKVQINKMYKKIEIDLDGVYKRLLLLKKKKYACVKVVDYNTKQFVTESKGLDIVRRDWCGLTKRIGNLVIETIFSDKLRDAIAADIHKLLEHTSSEMKSDKVPLEEYVITKALMKMPHEYADKKTQPHVQVALRMLSAGHTVKAGNEISYVICDHACVTEHLKNTEVKGVDNQDATADPDLSHVSSRAYTPDEMVEFNLKPDFVWYKAQQVLPVIQRLCEHIGGGAEVDRLASSLSLDGAKYRHRLEQSENAKGENTNYFAALIEKSDEQLYDQVDLPQKVVCPHCRHSIPCRDLLKHFRCNSCASWIPMSLIRFCVRRITWKLTHDYARFLHQCNDCGVATQRLTCGSSWMQCPQPDCDAVDSLEQVVPPRRLNLYILYLEHLLRGDLKSTPAASDTEDTTLPSAEVPAYIDVCAYSKTLPAELAKCCPKLCRLLAIRETSESAVFLLREEQTIGQPIGPGQPSIIDYNSERRNLRESMGLVREHNAYNRVGVTKLFGVFPPAKTTKTGGTSYYHRMLQYPRRVQLTATV